jgi:eukaryotic-like serine/threonine-protein kinase
MLTLDSFLQAIAADPHNAAVTWLVLADWLEEQDDLRCELVRLLHQPGYQRERAAEQRDMRLRELLDTVPPLFANTLNAHFTWVPPGTFWMGGGGGSCGEQQVTIGQGFALGVFLVTQAQWQAVMGDNPSYFSRTGDGQEAVKDISDEDLMQFPVETVSWDDAQEFIKKLNEKEHGHGWLYRLPTETEWEYACRGGANSEEECSYHFYFDQPTNDLSSAQANFDGNYPYGDGSQGPHLAHSTKVGSYRPNRLGLYDMHGNVWEWCQDLYKGGSFRVCRGGSWYDNASGCQAANRNRLPLFNSSELGCRLALVPVL